MYRIVSVECDATPQMTVTSSIHRPPASYTSHSESRACGLWSLRIGESPRFWASSSDVYLGALPVARFARRCEVAPENVPAENLGSKMALCS